MNKISAMLAKYSLVHTEHYPESAYINFSYKTIALFYF
jgi:hypothetical protein